MNVGDSNLNDVRGSQMYSRILVYLLFFFIISQFFIPLAQGGSEVDPEVTDPSEDAPDSTGENNDHCDILAVWFHNVTQDEFLISMILLDLEDLSPTLGSDSTIWQVLWRYDYDNNGSWGLVIDYCRSKESWRYWIGYVEDGSVLTSYAYDVEGTYSPFRPGIFTVIIPRNLANNPPDGTTITEIKGDSHERYGYYDYSVMSGYTHFHGDETEPENARDFVLECGDDNNTADGNGINDTNDQSDDGDGTQRSDDDDTNGIPGFDSAVFLFAIVVTAALVTFLKKHT